MQTSCLSLYLQKIGDKKLLDVDEERILAEIIREGGPDSESAKNIMIESNLKLVVAIAKEHQYTNIDLEDIIAEGNLGLIKAIEKFDHTKGHKLSTYACWWIRQHILQAISEQTKTIRMPIQAINKVRKLKKIIAALTSELTRIPTIQEIAEETSIPPEKLEEILQWGLTPISLSDIEENTDMPLEQTLEDESAKNPLLELLKKSDAQWAINLLNNLTKKEQEVVSKRYGIGKEKETHTLEAIGTHFNVTRERIRQIEAKALKKLRKKISQLKTLQKN